MWGYFSPSHSSLTHHKSRALYKVDKIKGSLCTTVHIEPSDEDSMFIRTYVCQYIRVCSYELQCALHERGINSSECLCVFKFLYVYVMCVCMHICTCVCVCVYIYIYVSMCICICVCMCVRRYVRVYVCMYICVCVFVYASTYMTMIEYTREGA
jgi:hypothetical protein